MADMSKITEILKEESVDFNDCDSLPNIAQASLSLGHKIAQVVCESRTKPAEATTLSAFDVCAKHYGLFGVLCSLLTYLVAVFTNLESKAEKSELKANPDSAEAEPEKSPLLVTQQPVLHVLPQLPELTDTGVSTGFSAEDLTLDEKSLSISDDEKGDVDLRKFGDLTDLNLPENDVADIEIYKRNLDLPKCYARARSFSEPCGSEKYIAYQSLDTAFKGQAWIGELPVQVSPALMAVETKGNNEDVFQAPAQLELQPGSPSHLQTFNLAQTEPGQTISISTPPDQVVDIAEKVNERKPMVFIGGVSASTTSIELVTELKSQGFNVTVLPRIRYGVSFGFCPDLVLSSVEEVEKLLGMGRIWVKDRWVDVRPYIPKDSEMETPENPPEVIHIEDCFGGDVAYISHEDLLRSLPRSPSQTTSSNSSPTQTLSPVTPQFLPAMMPVNFYNSQFLPPFSPQLPSFMPPPGFYPGQQQGEFVFQNKQGQFSTPPGFANIQHPVSMDASFDTNITAY